MKSNSLKQPKTTNVVYNERFQFIIVHKDVSSAVDGTTHMTWKERNISFVWNIERPKTGVKNLSMNCPYCGKKMELTDVLSLEAIEQEKKEGRKLRKIVAIVFLCFLCGVLPITFIHPPWMNILIVVSMFGAVICGMGLLISVLSIRDYRSPNYGAGHAKGELKAEKIIGPYNQHYKDKVTGI